MTEIQKEKCFIITPIGNESDPIRRHIDGIIEAIIEPALGDKYEIVVSHKINSLGTITKQIIKEICEDKLVICNLTEKNPNVMYELALRHCTGKPAILIAEDGTTLPSDILLERTTFYRNDAKGTLELRNKLVEIEKDIKFEEEGSPIHDVLREVNVEAKFLKNTEGGTSKNENGDAMKFILQKLNRIEDSLQNKISVSPGTMSLNSNQKMYFIYRFKSKENVNVSDKNLIFELDRTLNKIGSMAKIYGLQVRSNIISIEIISLKEIKLPLITISIRETLSNLGFEDVELIDEWAIKDTLF